MSQLLFFVFVGGSSFVALSDWRKGLLLMIIAGLLQDPIRKLMPGAPSYMVLAFIPVWMAICAAVLFSGNRIWDRFLRAEAEIGNGIRLLAYSLVLALLVLILKYGFGALIVGAIGFIGYLFPVLAMAIGYFFVRTPNDLIVLMKFYCLVTAVVLIGGLLENQGLFPEWEALGTSALGMTWIRHFPGHIVYLTSGFFRSPDLLGWHAGLLVMFSMIMIFRANNPMIRALWLGLAVWGAVILLMSGRNKMIFMPAVFITVVGAIYIYKGHLGRFMGILFVGGISFSLFLAANTQLGLDEDYLLYTQKGSTEASSRLVSGGIYSVWGTYQQRGFFGEGLGSASTGARYGGNIGLDTWQETGLSKLMVELGVIGFISGIIFFIAIIRSMWRSLKKTPFTAPEFQLYVGFLGLVVANAASFIVSHQAFGDPFLVTLAGFMTGIALSASRWRNVTGQTG